MSVKAKVEALIYATEEPVTLNQLATLLKDAVLAELRSEEEARLARNEVLSDGKPAVEVDESADEGREVAVTPAETEPQREYFDGKQISPHDLTQEQQAELDKEDLKRVKELPRPDSRGLTGRIFRRQPRNGDTPDRWRLPDGHQARASRRGRQLRQELEAAGPPFDAGAGDARRDRIQAAGDSTRDQRDSWRRFLGSHRYPARPQIDHDVWPQAGHRTADPCTKRRKSSCFASD